MTHLSALLHSLSKAAVEVLAGTVVSPQISPGEGFTSKIIWLSKYFDSLWVVGLRTSVSASCWLKEDLISWMCGLFYNLTMSFIEANEGRESIVSLKERQKSKSYVP